MRALALVAVSTMALAGCHSTRACKAGTVLLTVDMPAGTDTLQYVVTIDGTSTAGQSVALPSSTATSGTLELDFSTYPAGSTVTVTVTALGAGSVLGAGTSDARVLAARCDTLHVTATGMVLGGTDLGIDDGGAGDLAGSGANGCTSATDCPMGQSCDTTMGTCSTSCSASQPCNGGCCDGTACAPGNTTATCALSGTMCGTCSASPDGKACLAIGGAAVCGCMSATDCPANLACNTTTHKCGSACDASTPCNGGCCTSASGGTCQTGTANPVCGNNGNICGDCASNQNGHVCIVVTGGGQCGCNPADANNGLADCPSGATSCTANLCVNTCSSSAPCLSGCCSSATSGTCQPGTTQAVCGAVGSVCTSCVGNANGTACLSSGACGCNSASDCAPGHACDTSVHHCTTSCSPTQLCNTGCCSSGTCVGGGSLGACGSSGNTCAVCPSNTACASYSCDGTSCNVSYTPAGTVCNPGDPSNCLNPATCTGSSASCPLRKGCAVGSCCSNSRCVTPCP